MPDPVLPTGKAAWRVWLGSLEAPMGAVTPPGAALLGKCIPLDARRARAARTWGSCSDHACEKGISTMPTLPLTASVT